MKKHVLVGVLAVAMTVGFGTAVLADGGGDSGDDGQQGGDIQGVENLHAEIILVATTNAPAGATGKAELEGDDTNGVANTFLKIETEGLAPGTYDVTLTDQSGTNSFDLGTFDVGLSTNAEDNGDGEVEFGGDGGLPLPDGLNPMSLGVLTISDSNAVAMLVGDFSSATNAQVSVFNANVTVTPGTAGPNVQGHAVMHVQSHKGKNKGKFLLVVQGAPASQTLSVLVNGSTVGTVKSSKQGKVMLKSLPGGVDLHTVTSVEIEDGGSNVVCSVSF